MARLTPLMEPLNERPMSDRTRREGGELPRATLADTLALARDVILPTLAKGVIIRRPKVVGLTERLDLDRRAVRRVQRLRRVYGDGPLMLKTPPGWPKALVLSPEHVGRVLAGAPEPFSPASSEKRAALSHFQPKGVLISEGPERADRRRFNEEVLNTGRVMHQLSERFAAVVEAEAERLLARVGPGGTLAWDAFAETWFRVVRRVVFGDGAADDEELTELVNRLRADANWAFLHPKRTALCDEFYARLQGHLDRAEPGSLAGVMAQVHATRDTAPAQQVPQWLFAFDPAGMTTFRALALLAAHPEHLARARAEVADRPAQPELPFLRAVVLESLRLWPTTPLVLRETTEATTWETGVMPAGTGVVIFAPYFHRDDERLLYADTFTPGLWFRARTWPLIPFSEGPAMCPGRHLVLLTTSTMLAALLAEHVPVALPPRRLDARRPLPATLDNYRLRFALRPARRAPSPGRAPGTSVVI